MSSSLYRFGTSLTYHVAWAKIIDDTPSFLDLQPTPKANDASIKQHERFGKLFDETDIPDHVEGFECKDAERMAELWPEGMDHAKEVSQVSLSIGWELIQHDP